MTITEQGLDLIGVEEGAAILKVHPKTFARYLREGMFPRAFQMNGYEWRLPRADVYSLVPTVTAEGEQPAANGQQEPA